MNTRMMIRLFTLLLASLLGSACGEKNPSPEPPATESTPAALLDVFQAVSAPVQLLPIPELRKQVEPGQAVVFEGKVMGADQVFVDQRAVVIVGDEGTITSCELMPDDHCATPWDTCCEDLDVLRAGTVTVQIMGENGLVLRHGLRGVNGLKELSRLRVAGKVAPGSTAEALVINATAIEVL